MTEHSMQIGAIILACMVSLFAGFLVRRNAMKHENSVLNNPMAPTHFFTRKGGNFVLIATLLCLIGVEVTKHSFTKYNIPFVGWMLAVREYQHANAAYWKAVDHGAVWHDYYSTQTAYNHTHIASVSTLTVLAVCLIVVNRILPRILLTFMKGNSDK
jgi:hypothetical protein